MSKKSGINSPIKYPLLSKSRIDLITGKLSPILAQVFGYHALLYSSLAKTLCSDALCIKQQVVIGKEGENISLKCHFEELPIASDSIDLALLPGVLQQSHNPHQVLREVERVLIPEGVVVLIGRNPLSWQGISQRIKQRNVKPEHKFKDISRGRIGDWFRLLGLEAESIINISVTNDRLQKSHSYFWVKRLGQIFCDYFCSYYIIVARKKVSTLTPIRPSWRRNKHLVPPRLAEPSVKSQVEHWFEQLK
ncbi:class I SAM-dependent methyltransferase [Aliikangiella sp. IMCC44359]|uniref:class I SAM-dependent methyltransferase n=1 Tax=Aliikangiella sp. IMCC44359 TaxID=3459125 RepID=UPI00403A9504